jgi:hypothetical protein
MESNDVTVDPAAAAAQLAALRSDRAAMADWARQPAWYDPALGVLVFLPMAAASTRTGWVLAAAAAVFLVGLLVLRWGYQRATGVWVSGVRPGRTRRAITAWAVLYGLTLAVGLYCEFRLEWRGAMAVAGVVLGVGIALISRWWTRLYAAELRAQP